MAENRTIKYLHIWNGSNYATINSFTKLINENFPNREEHFFIVRDNKDNPKQLISQYDNVLWLPNAEKNSKDFKILCEYLTKSQFVFWHAMGWYWKTQFKLLMKPKIMKKSLWVEWGRDLYEWERTDGNPIVRAVVNRVCYLWRTKVKGVVTIFPADKNVYIKKFGTKVPVYYAEYCAATSDFTLSQKPEPTNDGKIHILVGHSAVPECNHMEVLEKLARFKNENIVIHIPLTYGNMDYGKQVAEKAKELFSEETLDIMTEHLTMESYVKFLWTVDVGIFNVNRQIALGNIARLLFMKKKVYLPKNSVLYDFYEKNDTEIYPYEMIDNCSFEEFTKKPKMTEPSKYILSGMDGDNIIKQWCGVFENACKE